ncbi:MAG: aconitate hydratase [Elusimicrobia bacterium CG06_land_8_20_14_3_00_38_11]|nr:MAG: aconitate hydratase [Elusimicrobia bacterium CG06_land_8_20_14_3_00_38_11]
MKKNLVQKIIEKHLLEGNIISGEEIGIKIDQTLTQDATGTIAYLEFEAMGVKKIKTKLSVSYIDHNTLQTGFENADDHLYLQSIAEKYGLYFSPNGNGVCHQVHLERFSKPGETLIGSDSHTPTAGAIGMLAIGVGGLDVAYALATGRFYLNMPKVVNIKLSEKLNGWSSAKDIILELLRRLTVKGGVGKIFEYSGEGVKTVSVYERATITNMGAELGLTTSIFPSDEQTKKFLKLQNRENDFKEISADEHSEYDEIIEIDLSKIVPLVACPNSPDNVRNVKDIEGTKLDQVIIGSCTNSSLTDLLLVAKILKGKKVKVSTIISPGSKQIFINLLKLGALSDLVESGVRVLEPACGPCIGMGCAPVSGGVSLRTFNRNFKGRSGTDDAEIYISGPVVAAFSALTGKITEPSGKIPRMEVPKKIKIMDDLIIAPRKTDTNVVIFRGKNIVPIKKFNKVSELENVIVGEVVLKLKDNITTDDIIPAGAKILPLRSNIPAISEYVFSKIDSGFVARVHAVAKKSSGIIVAGENYGQGSSREHAALCPKYLGIKVIIAKSYARIHKSNLVNFGIMPLIFKDPTDYEKIDISDKLEIENVQSLPSQKTLTVKNIAKNFSFNVTCDLTERQLKLLLSGGLLNCL